MRPVVAQGNKCATVNVTNCELDSQSRNSKEINILITFDNNKLVMILIDDVQVSSVRDLSRVFSKRSVIIFTKKSRNLKYRNKKVFFSALRCIPHVAGDERTGVRKNLV